MKYRQILVAGLVSLPLIALAQVPVSEGGGRVRPLPTLPGSGGAQVGGGAVASPSAQGELFMQLQQMQQEMSRLRGMVEEQQHEIQRLKQESLERYQQLDSRLNQTQAAPSSASAPAAPAVAPEPADPEKEKLYYDAAFDLIKAKDFDKASQAFNAFLRRYPSSRYAANARYWLGEVALVKGDLQAAGQAFARVTLDYPDHGKVPDALYKLADVERRLGRVDKARAAFQEVIAKYPETSAAKLAERDLKNLR
ncbi:MAG TPA: tol-pal system protein YbgF [Pseudomonas sp.]|nr:tol-pal system protein YbgF [Pseudomonas sp.]